MKTAIKFTRTRRRPIFGGGAYPPVGEWSETRCPVLCESGWHVAEEDWLTEHLGAEAWLVEVSGQSVTDGRKSAYTQIRFVRQLSNWTPQAAASYATDCAIRAASVANGGSHGAAHGAVLADRAASDGQADGSIAAVIAGGQAARAFGADASHRGLSSDEAYARERRTQSQWFKEMILS